MVVYFTGTGNSRFIAKKLGELLEDEVFPMSNDLKRDGVKKFSGDKPLVFVTPTYMSRMPPAAEKYIRNAVFAGNKDAYFVFSAAEAVGNAAKYCEKLCKKKELNYKGTAAVKSPANYVVMYDVTPKEEAREEMEKSIPAISSIADSIRGGGHISLDGAFGGHKPFSAVAPAVMKLTSAKGFKANDDCISCGLCARACPLGNIELKDGKPEWGANCTHCMGCISICPKKAIDYGNKTQNRNRYYLN